MLDRVADGATDLKTAEIGRQPLSECKKEEPSVIVEDVDDDDNSSDSNFIEVNSGNMASILEGDNDILQNLHDSDMFNTTMDEGTTLDDFN